MPREVIAERTAEVDLDWLAALNGVDPSRGQPRVNFAKVTIPEGSSVYMDEDGPRFRMKTPQGKIVAWDKFKRIQVEPGEYWGITWLQPGQVEDPDFGFSMADGKLTILLERMEGHEHLFADFVATFSDPDMCPGGFRAPDGRYESNMLIDFMVTWGGDGVPPSLAPVQETLAVQPEVPSEFLIEFEPGTLVNCTKAKGVVEPEAETYVADVRSYNIHTGEVREIRYRLPGNSLEHFKTDGAELFRLVAAKQAAIVEILQDRKRQY
ncbi:hypothetical protein [Bradyrhizobium ottawaense]|uniref:hypothetical protein n=1 Tax=Bradyrhizobium ottawaense TaxID=931866 RepID=UPI0030C74DC8